MTRTVKKLNETRYHLDNMVEVCKQKIIALESAKAILLLDHQKNPKNSKNPITETTIRQIILSYPT